MKEIEYKSYTITLVPKGDFFNKNGDKNYNVREAGISKDATTYRLVKDLVEAKALIDMLSN